MLVTCYQFSNIFFSVCRPLFRRRIQTSFNWRIVFKTLSLSLFQVLESTRIRAPDRQRGGPRATSLSQHTRLESQTAQDMPQTSSDYGKVPKTPLENGKVREFIQLVQPGPLAHGGDFG